MNIGEFNAGDPQPHRPTVPQTTTCSVDRIGLVPTRLHAASRSGVAVPYEAGPYSGQVRKDGELEAAVVGVDEVKLVEDRPHVRLNCALGEDERARAPSLVIAGGIRTSAMTRSANCR